MMRGVSQSGSMVNRTIMRQFHYRNLLNYPSLVENLQFFNSIEKWAFKVQIKPYKVPFVDERLLDE